MDKEAASRTDPQRTRAFCHGPEDTATLAAGPDLPAWCLPQPCPWPRSPSSAQPRVICPAGYPQVLRRGAGWPGRNGTACAVVTLGSSLVLPCGAALLQLLPGTFVGAASSSSGSRTCTWAISQTWLVQTGGKRGLGLCALDILSMQ